MEALTWAEIPGVDYEKAFDDRRRAPLLQSPLYAAAVAEVLPQRPRWFEVGGSGIAQVLETRALGGLIHGAVLDRGPLIDNAFGDAALAGFSKRFPRRPGRRRRVIPECALSGAPGDLCPLPGRPPYQTIWLDLDAEDDALRAGMRSNWRRDLARGEREVVEISTDWLGDELAWLLATNEDALRLRGQDPPSRALMVAIARSFLPRKRCLIVRAGTAAHPLAAALFLLHGRAATYQVGWISAAGRRRMAGHLCLMQGIGIMRDRSIVDLDLGGVNDRDARGVKRFKQGLGGDLVTLPRQMR